MDITPTAGPMSMDVLSLINSSRQTYGLRHQDYQRYREYCTNRIHRLRQILKLTQANNKQTNIRKSIPQEINDVRYLHLLIYESERAWAFSMELKQESSKSMDTRQRHHLVKRLKRASQYAQQLYTLCENQTVDSRTVLDVKAYAALMKGYLLFEQQHWQEALDQLTESRTIYEKFAKLNSNAEQEALCYSFIDTIDPNIRFCAYKLGINKEIDDIVSSYHSDALNAQLATIQSNKKETVTKFMTWRQKEFTIKVEALVQAVEEKDWSEAEKLIKKALKEDKEATAKITSSKSAKATEDLKIIFTMVEYNLFGNQIQRNLASIANTDKPQQAVKLYDDIMKNIEYIWELPNVRDDLALDGELNVLSLYYKAQRCIQVALSYADMKKTPESLAIYQRAQLYVVQAKQELAQIKTFSSDALLRVSESDLLSVENIIRSGTWKSRAAWFLEHGSQDQDEVTEKLDQLNLDADALIDQLDAYPSVIQPNHLVDFPPKFQPVACKPFYFDLAANFVKYPEQSLNERTEKTTSGSGFWNIFGRK
ncbi:hypothetical protein INT47_002885 [Mucor saturninus]|uniref:Signal recognition particle subunit SRP68 n=1 Tax=Mucor saturninus TaxID=64648 RepID=A0A8H7QQ56_9FUNG|nr:hypothetical protein INT47_002885 [Mucor saturninus]